ncbi:endonuclease/exonuclease/phosphatase family protein [Candidatus Saccharibacteria bacterium]|nr:endonuclease/exonuclease/phosphatase family protein [Candidatus Saccharibacteria bacterium]
MRILYWNTCITTDPQALFDRLSLFHQLYGGIDYFCLNEATPQLVELMRGAGWRIFHVDNTDVKGVAIASRHPLRQKRSYLLSSVSRQGRQDKNHLLMVEAYWRNKPVTIATTHLTYLRFKEIRRRRQERKELVRILPRNRTVFGGDLNTIVIPFAKWDVEQLGYQNKVKGKTWCWHLKNTLRRIPVKLQLDYVFATHDIRDVVEAKILKEQGISDHFPILVTLY